MSQTIKSAIRINKRNPNHHLWLNREVWWCHFTVHENKVAKRMRFSLKTEDIELARQRRDRILKDLSEKFRA